MGHEEEKVALVVRRLTLRCRGRCAIKPRSAPDLERLGINKGGSPMNKALASLGSVVTRYVKVVIYINGGGAND